jgi:hypothetical protein
MSNDECKSNGYNISTRRCQCRFHHQQQSFNSCINDHIIDVSRKDKRAKKAR